MFIFPTWDEIFSAALPAIPRVLTGLAEWGAVLLAVIMLPKRFPKAVTGVFLALFLPIQIVLRCVGSYEVGDALMMVFFTGMVVNLCFMFLCIFMLAKVRVPVALFFWAAAFLWAEFAASLSWQICGFFMDAPTLLSLSGALLTLLPLTGCSVGAWLLFRDKAEILEEYPWEMAALAVIIALLTFLASNTNVLQQTLWHESDSRPLRMMIGTIRTLVDLAGVVLFFLMVKNTQKKRLERDMAAINGLVNLQYQQYLDFRDRSAYIARQCHDLKHQVAALRKNCTPEEQEQYLSELEDSINRYSLNCNTGNPVLDTILTQKLLYCGAHDIQLGYTAEARELEALSTRDICIIFGNLLDNAIEYVSELQDPERRQILVNAATANQFLHIEVENCCDWEISPSSTLPATTKQDRTNHGYGGKSVAYTVEKYGGTMQVQAADGWFTVSILIPLNQS